MSLSLGSFHDNVLVLLLVGKKKLNHEIISGEFLPLQISV